MTRARTAVLDTLVVGAGPYGLSLSAHLRRAGVTHKVMGRTMEAWRQMPKGICLRSTARASNLCDPDGVLTLEAFASERGRPLDRPLPAASFIEYGDWFAERAGVDVDPRLVTELTAGETFSAVLDDGEQIRARRVVVAAGTNAMQWTPPEYRGLPRELVSHVAEHDDLGVFAGKRVLVVGAGQSSIECAAIAHESGAEVSVVMRSDGVRWLTRSAELRASRLAPLLYSWSEVGPAGLSQLVSFPGLFRLVPGAPRHRATSRCARPAAAAWLIPRTRDVAMLAHDAIRDLTAVAGRVRVRYERAPAEEFDHVLLGTGYRVDLARYGFLAPELRAAVRTADGSPVLGRAMQSSVRGLYFLGLPAAWSYGPLMRHVCGAHFAARAVTAQLARARSTGPQLISADVEPARAA